MQVCYEMLSQQKSEPRVLVLGQDPNNLDSVMPLCRGLVESRKGKMIRKGWSVKERVWGLKIKTLGSRDVGQQKSEPRVPRFGPRSPITLIALCPCVGVWSSQARQDDP